MPDESLYHLAYRSVASPDLDGEGLLELLTHARLANQRYHLTGLLLVSGPRIMQFLEGPAQAVGDVYSRIERDPRHHSVELVFARPASQREFPDWAMGLVGADALPPGALPPGLIDTSQQTYLLVRQANFSPATRALLADFLGSAVWML